jgi:predicted transcriptional regulator
MINTKNITAQERATKIDILRQEHQPYFDKIGKSNALFLPKMAYRPPGKDELYISFFESELKNECDIYTEFVSKQYDSEDPKRTLYLVKYNPFWKEEYELMTSKTGYERFFIPVSEIEPISTIADRIKPKAKKEPHVIVDILKEKKEEKNSDIKDLIQVLSDINYSLQTLTHIIRNLNPKETFIINPANKTLPFKGWKKNYSLISKDNPKGNMSNVCSANGIIKCMKHVNDNMPHIKNLIIDDWQYMSA